MSGITSFLCSEKLNKRFITQARGHEAFFVSTWRPAVEKPVYFGSGSSGSGWLSLALSLGGSASAKIAKLLTKNTDTDRR